MIGHAARAAGWLPGPDNLEVESVLTLPFPNLELRVPRLTAGGLATLLERVAANRDAYLADLPIDRIVTLIDRVASRWLDPASPFRREAERLLPLVTGYAEPAVRKGLMTYLSTLRGENVRRLLEEELPDPLVLDGFQPRRAGGGETRAFGPRLTVQVWSGNVPGLPAQSLLTSLLLKSAAVGKVAAAEPLFATLLAESIAEVDPRLAECLAVVYWPGGDEALERIAFNSADAVIAYGGEQTMQSVRARLRPDARFMPYGHKLSFGAVAREAVASDRLAETADRAAYDVSKYDQQGCLSPHLFYIETGGEASPRDFSLALGEALDRHAARVPRGRLQFEEAASLATARHGHEVRQLAGEPVLLIEGAGWAVLFDEDPSFQASCLNRTVWVKPVADLQIIPDLIRPIRRYLQTCGIAADAGRRRTLAGQLGRLGVDRVCPLGRMADVAPTWHHDGRFTLLELLRWTDLEPEASAGRWEFTHPHLGLYGED